MAVAVGRMIPNGFVEHMGKEMSFCGGREVSTIDHPRGLDRLCRKWAPLAAHFAAERRGESKRYTEMTSLICIILTAAASPY